MLPVCMLDSDGFYVHQRELIAEKDTEYQASARVNLVGHQRPTLDLPRHRCV